MTVQGVLQIVVLLGVVAVVGIFMGRYMFGVFEKNKTFLDPVLLPVERSVYKVCGIDPTQEMRWTTYALCLLAVNVVGFVVLFILLGLQSVLPLNPAHQAHVPFWTSWNTAISFVTNTNWQNYGGETTLSYLSQMWLTVQQFLSPVSGICILLVVVRGFSRSQSNTVGNFWKDFIRCLLWVAVPFAILGTIILVALGSPQNLHGYIQVSTLGGGHQKIAQGPVASMTSIMQWGDNGGGFFATNAAHPYEAPNVASLLVQLIMGFAVSAGCIWLFGRMIKDVRQSRAVFVAMAIMFSVGALVMYHYELVGNPIVNSAVVSAKAKTANHTATYRSNWEGKETRFGIGTTTLFENSTTAVSWGSTAASNDSLTPIGGMMTLFNMTTGEVIFGSWGVGMVGMIAFAILAIFLAGLMVGRTPEYLGKKIESYEVKMAVLAMIVTSFAILVLAALSLAVKPGISGIYNPGPHGLTEVLYAFSSGVGNNGSAFGGLNAASPWYSLTVGIAMLLGRYAMYIPLLAVGGSMALKQRVPVGAGTFPTHGPLFIGLLIGTVIIVGALIFFPALALGPLAEHFSMQAGRLF
ncbi:MAG: potassium-transporting ATPase subunit KdpA [Actinobacteria bacterium]|nr:potassium-transporting ATPase subunit KdpA [Actinomycetota bacterium]MCL6105267.1 potassium-transporting ATPase subunit KdpA [Actinomycetota bacterium]